MKRGRKQGGRSPSRSRAAASSRRRAGYEPPRLWRVDLPGLEQPLEDDTSPLVAQGQPSSPNVAPVTVFPGPPPP